MNYWMLKETIFHTEGDTVIREKPFKNKNEIIRALKKSAPIYSNSIYELTKNNQCYLEFGGTRRKFEIYEESSE